MGVVNKELIQKVRDKVQYNKRKIVDVLHKTGGGHYGGSLSSAEIITTLYEVILNIDSRDPQMEGRDFFILSKGHCNAVLSTVLATRGFFDEADLYNFNKMGSSIGMHPTSGIPGIEISTGSLGHGLSIGVGIAAALKADGKESKVYVLCGDGELHEGQIWEAVMAAYTFKLDNLVAIVDRNKLSMDGPTESVTISLDPLIDKWKAFNWASVEVDGHDIEELIETFNTTPFEKNKPSAIIANTIKGKGVDFMENAPEWHYNVMTDDLYHKAINQL